MDVVGFTQELQLMSKPVKGVKKGVRSAFDSGSKKGSGRPLTRCLFCDIKGTHYHIIHHICHGQKIFTCMYSLR